MKTIHTHMLNLEGTNAEIGQALGRMAAEIPALRELHSAGMPGFDSEKVREARELFKRWCPGLNAELDGFAAALGVAQEQVFFYAMTYLTPRCSLIALLPSLSADGKPLVARNYEFTDEMEDFCLVRTAVTGKYAHIGTSVLNFGRDDGINECGLSVVFSACGFPVGPIPNMRAPKIKGLQHWAVIRGLLENCRDVDESLSYLEGMPVASNMNLILADKSGKAALVETIDGHVSTRCLGPYTDDQIIFATNHAILPELFSYEPEVMAHSVKRYDYIAQELAGKTAISREKLKEMLLAEYPNGLRTNYFAEYFGTTKSMILSPVDGTIELCWGGRKENGWETYQVSEALENSTKEININIEKADSSTWEFLKRDAIN
ncbi:C45 family autoproteolytic acyltransferase/hydolase [Lactovum odontotermitis]